MKEINERLLHAWLQMITAVDSERVASELPYNEAIVCNMLYMKQASMTASDLCKVCKMAKSLMNRTLTSLENKQLIKRVKDEYDKRQIKIQLIIDEQNTYFQQHLKSLKYVGKIMKQVGTDKVEEIIALFTSIAQIASKENI